MREEITAQQIVKWYEESIAYQSQLGLRATIPECVRFYEGDQWAKVTEDTKHFPRPVVNIIEMICNNKKSQVLSSPIQLVYKAENGNEAVEKFNRFSDYEQSRIRQRDMNNRAVLDGIIKGSYCFYGYWDKDIVGIDGLVEGDIGAQVVDPLDVHFADPTEKDEQKQKWIILTSREDIEKIKKEADAGVDKGEITEDDNNSVYNEKESDTTKYATVFTFFFRQNDEVYFLKATKGVIFTKPRPFTPNVKQTKNRLEGKEEIEEEPKPEDKYLKTTHKATKYPIVFSAWKERDKSIYGRGEVEKLIPNQKAINWNWGLQLLMSQDEAMGVTVVKPDTLRGQQITNEPNQIITDYSREGNGIKKLETKQMTQGSMNIAERLADVTRVVTNSSEIMNGEVISAGMSGAAIAQLQAQALKPVEDLQKGVWRSMEKWGEILEQFFRFFFTDKKFKYKDKEENLLSDQFNSEDFKSTSFDVVAEAVAGTVMSGVADINLLDNLFEKGAITLKTYISSYPQNALANRQKLLESIEEEKNEIVNQLTAQIEQAQAQLAQAQQLIQAQEQTINNAKSIVDENRTLKEKLLALQAEYMQKQTEQDAIYTEKMNIANKILIGALAKAEEHRADATKLAENEARRLGILKNQGGQPL